MEYILQRALLRCPLVYDYDLRWDPTDLDGGCEAWRRFQEKAEGHRIIRGRATRTQLEQQQLIEAKKAIATDIWQQRINDNADREGWGLEINENDSSSTVDIEDDHYGKNDSAVVDNHLEKSTEIDGKNKFAIEDVDLDNNDDDDDGDDNGTIYSRALLDPPAPHNIFSCQSLSTSTASIDSYVTAPCTLESMTLQYASFNWADDVEDAEAAGEVAAPIQPAPETTMPLEAQEPPTTFIQSHLNALDEELQRQAEALKNSRTLGCELFARASRKYILSPNNPCCAWKWLPLYYSHEDHEKSALASLTNGRCRSERAPTLIVTNEDGEHFRLLEVRKVLTEEEIAEIRQSRDQAQAAAGTETERYDLYNEAALEGQTPAERLAVDRAKAWWDAEQKKRNATYVDWKHAEAQELVLLQQQIELEVELYFKHLAVSAPAKRRRRHLQEAKAEQIKHLAALKFKLAENGLRPQGNGLYAGFEYSVTFTDRTLRTVQRHRDEIDSIVFLSSRCEETEDEKAREQERLDKLRQAEMGGCLKLAHIIGRREIAIQERYAYRNGMERRIELDRERKALIQDWLNEV
jgi:hypothetical protein